MFDTRPMFAPLQRFVQKKRAFNEHDIITLFEGLSLPTKKHVLRFNAIRSALTYILQGGLKRNISRIFIPAFLCPIIAETAKCSKTEVVLLDADLETYNVDLSILKNYTLNKQDAVFINHTFGNSVDIKSNGALIISDNAGALFSSISGKPAGAHADVILYHFHKQLAGCNGALMFCNRYDKKTYAGLTTESLTFRDFFALFAQQKGIVQSFLSIYRKRTPLYKALPVSDEKIAVSKSHPFAEQLFFAQLKWLHDEVKARQRNATLYKKHLRHPRIIHQKINGKSSYQHYSIRVDADVRDPLLRALRKQGVFADRMWYNASVTHDTPHAKILADTVLNLPIRGSYTEKDIIPLCSAVINALEALV